MVFILFCIQPPEEAWATPPVPNPRSKADGGAGHPHISSQASAAISGAADEPLCMWLGNAALGLMLYGMSQIAVGRDCNQLGETVETLRVCNLLWYP